MRHLLLLFFIGSWAANLRAQTSCNEDSVLAIVGKWKKNNDANMRPYKNLVQLTSRIDRVSHMFQEAYPQPRGTEARWYRNLQEEPLVEGGPLAYDFHSLYQYWYCNKNVDSLMLSGETSNWGFVFFNSLNGILDDQQDRLKIKINGHDVYLLPNAVGQWKGNALYDFSGSRCIILMHKNKLPWKAVTQGEYLEALKTEWEDQKKKTAAGYDEILSDRKKTIKEWEDKKDVPAAYKDRIISSLRNDLEEWEKNQKTQREKIFKYWDEKIAVIERYIADKAHDLNQPAVIERTPEQFNNFSGSFAENSKGESLVVLDPSYFEKQLPAYVSQLIVLKWSWEENAAGRYYKKRIEENFPLDKLREMIDR
ncbi:MAG TPA: hypothetical protein VNR87_06985 [Flavisolibacter sp.]|nr:hypothetical protein [Flavisolibacter sp.]